MTLWRSLLIAVCLIWGNSALALSDIEADAQEAKAQLLRAQSALQQASSSRDRVKALTQTIQAYEMGLSAIRDGLRRLTLRRSAIADDFKARESELTELLGTLYLTTNTQNPTMMVHPQGPLGTARSAMLVADVTQGLQAKAAGLRADLQELAIITQLQQQAFDDLRTGLIGVQDARTALAQAVAERRDLPRRFIDDPLEMSLLEANAETLDSFAANIKRIAKDEVTDPLPDLTPRLGSLNWPIMGRVLRTPNQPDAAGVIRPGVIFAARPQSIVTTPTVATVRYAGQFADYGQVVILEPQPNILFIFLGLSQTYAEIGTVLPEGSPIGLLGGTVETDADLSEDSIKQGGNPLSETLYFEVRDNNTPIDPFDWLKKEQQS